MRRSLFAMLLLAALPFAASAGTKTLSYDYLEAGYVKTDTGGDATGWGLGASMSIDDRFNLFGDYIDSNADGHAGVDLKQWSIGAGFHHPVSDNMDLVSRFAWTSIDTAQSRETNGLTVEAGVRSALGSMMEGWAMAGYGDVDHGDGEFYTRLGAQAKFGASWGVAADVKFISGDTQWMVGPRVSW